MPVKTEHTGNRSLDGQTDNEVVDEAQLDEIDELRKLDRLK